MTRIVTYPGMPEPRSRTTREAPPAPPRPEICGECDMQGILVDDFGKVRLRRACTCTMGRLHYRFNWACRMLDALTPWIADRIAKGEDFTAKIFLAELQEKMTKTHHALAAVADPMKSEHAKIMARN